MREGARDRNGTAILVRHDASTDDISASSTTSSFQ
jgi:hypothetical protein